MSINSGGLFSSASDEWATPWPLFQTIDRVFHFDLDVSATPDKAKCERYFTPEVDGLFQNWHEAGRVCWMNPPYSNVEQWMHKAWMESEQGATVVCLVPARTDTRWFFQYVWEQARYLLFLRGRVKFVGPVENSSAPFPSVLVVYSKRDWPVSRLSQLGYIIDLYPVSDELQQLAEK